MTTARGLMAASLSLALMSAFTLVNHVQVVRAEGPSAPVEIVQTRVFHSYTPLRTVYQPSSHLLPGRHWNAQRGSRGIWEQHVRIVSRDGQEISRTVVSSGWYRAPRPHIIAVGIDPFETSRSFGGSSRPFTMSATEYDVYLGGAGSGRTCTGVQARRGIVAVDPRVIPLGTHLYVEGYGYCVAADTGGAIKGNRIDLCVESSREANRYGCHRVRVVIVP